MSQTTQYVSSWLTLKKFLSVERYAHWGLNDNEAEIDGATYEIHGFVV